MHLTPFSDFAHISQAVKQQQIRASDWVAYFLNRIDALNPLLRAYTSVLSERAMAQAEKIDQQVAQGIDPGPLAGVPFAVKNLFDIRDITTLAGSKINADNAPAQADAVLIQRLENAGAILVGALAMGEYAYDFTGENAHYGNCANPWDTQCMSGGSSSGSGSATAAGLAPLSLGSDTNGSIRVPASLCGLYGLKPTYGRLPRTGSYPFCDSLDHLGPLARHVSDLALAFDVLQGYDDGDHACAEQSVLHTAGDLPLGIDGLTIKRAAGYFDCAEFPQAADAMNRVCNALGVSEAVPIPLAAEGRAAAYVITNIESSVLHRQRLQQRAADFDPDTRDRFIAGALLPGSWYGQAQRVRQAYRQRVATLFRDTDLLVAPATPCTAPRIGQKTLVIGGNPQPLRPNLGYFTQPFSAIGLPSVVVPTLDPTSGMPIGVQLVAAPWREDLCLRAAYYLEQQGFTTETPTAITRLETQG